MLQYFEHPAQAVFHIDTNSIIVSNYKYLGVFEWRLNYKSCKTWIKLLERLIGGKGAVKLSLTFNWPNVSKAGGVASSLWFIGSVLVVNLNKYLFTLSPTGYKKSQCTLCFTERLTDIQMSTFWSCGQRFKVQGSYTKNK